MFKSFRKKEERKDVCPKHKDYTGEEKPDEKSGLFPITKNGETKEYPIGCPTCWKIYYRKRFQEGENVFETQSSF